MTTQSGAPEPISIDEAEWAWLKPHAERDALIIVGRALPLEQAARAVAEDAAQEVLAWIKQGIFTKPTREQVSAWDLAPSTLFRSAVVQPYVLIQELLMH